MDVAASSPAARPRTAGFFARLEGTLPWLALAVIMIATALMFLPVVFVHPVRVRRWRRLTLAMLGLWAIAAGATLWQGMAPDVWSKAGLALAACYFVGLGLARARGPRA